MNPETLRQLITDLTNNQTIFSVDFTKKNGESRTIQCRLGVKKGTNGKGLNFDPIEKGLLPVYDMQKQGFRMITLSTVTELRAGGQVYRFEV